MPSSTRRRRSKRDLSTPRYGDRFGSYYDPEGFGRFSERIAHTMGTARFLVIQTGFVIVWIALAVFTVDSLRSAHAGARRRRAEAAPTPV